MRFTREQSEDIYRAIYQAMTHKYSTDVIWDGENARPIASGSALPHHIIIANNIQPWDFGNDFNLEEYTEDEFVDMCMECLGIIDQ